MYEQVTLKKVLKALDAKRLELLDIVLHLEKASKCTHRTALLRNSSRTVWRNSISVWGSWPAQDIQKASTNPQDPLDGTAEREKPVTISR